VNISFPLRLSSAPELKFVSTAQSGTPSAVTGCNGTAAEPKAEEGKLCVYAQTLENVEPEPTPPEQLLVDATSGTTLVFEATEAEIASEGLGTWAVRR
jgi:hypothetical protein